MHLCRPMPVLSGGPRLRKSSQDWREVPESGRFLPSLGRGLAIQEGSGTAVSWGLAQGQAQKHLLWPRAPDYHVPGATHSKHKEHNETEHLKMHFLMFAHSPRKLTNSKSFIMKFLDVRLPILKSIVKGLNILLWADCHINTQHWCDMCSKRKILSLVLITQER